MKTIDRVLILIGILIVSVAVYTYQSNNTYGSAPTGLRAMAATSSSLVVGIQSNATWFDGVDTTYYSQCASRTISTAAQAINISFTGISSSTATTTVSNIRGFYQPASTTVTYDGGQYGCGHLGFYGFGASSTINILESR